MRLAVKLDLSEGVKTNLLIINSVGQAAWEVSF